MSDGTTHINIYSKGQTELGRMLSNFYHSPFNHPTYGNFHSVEGFYYYLQIRMVAEEFDAIWVYKEIDKLKTLSNYDAKKKGQDIKSIFDEDMYFQIDFNKFKKEIKKAIEMKLEQNENIKTKLIESTLPLDHYYVYGDKKVELPQFKYITEYIELLRKNYKSELEIPKSFSIYEKDSKFYMVTTCGWVDDVDEISETRYKFLKKHIEENKSI